MQARLKTSKKWTAFPKEYVDQIQSVFRENFSQQLAGNSLLVEGHIYPSEVMLRVGIKEKGRLRQANFEVSMDYDTKKKDAVERIHNCIDAAASMMMDYFESKDDAELPRAWQEYPFQGEILFLKFSTENSDLEAQANALLGETADSLVLEEEGEDALARAEVDSTLTDDSEKISGPKMFGARKNKKKGELM